MSGCELRNLPVGLPILPLYRGEVVGEAAQVQENGVVHWEQLGALKVDGIRLPSGYDLAFGYETEVVSPDLWVRVQQSGVKFPRHSWTKIRDWTWLFPGQCMPPIEPGIGCVQCLEFVSLRELRDLHRKSREELLRTWGRIAHE